MTLSVVERLAILSILPKEGSITTLRIIRDLQKELSFTEEEYDRLQMTFAPDGRYEWKQQFDTGKDIEIGPVASGLIRKGFEAISDTESMNILYLPIYERFEEAH